MYMYIYISVPAYPLEIWVVLVMCSYLLRVLMGLSWNRRCN